jgi:hypothetical protein
MSDLNPNLHYRSGLDDAINIVAARMQAVYDEFKATPWYRVRKWRNLARAHTELFNVGRDLHVLWMDSMGNASKRNRDEVLDSLWHSTP